MIPLRKRHSFIILVVAALLLPMTVRAQVPVVPPQEPGPDGGLVHVVQFGDTLDGILNAYIDRGVTMERLLELNGWRFRPQFIFVDETIIVLPPGSVEPGDGLPVPADVAPPAATTVPQADAQAQPDGSTGVEAPPAPPAEVRTADEIRAIIALEVIAPFVPILGDTSMVPASPAQPESQPEAMTESATEESPSPTEAVAILPTEESPPSEASLPTEEAPAPEASEATAAPEAVVEATIPLPEATPAEEVAPQPTVDVQEEATPPPIDMQEEVAAAPPIDLQAEDADMPDFMVALGQLCARFYDDINQNGRRDTDEAALPGGLIILEDGASATADENGVGCLVDLGAGSLTIQAAAPDGYGITSPDALRVQVAAGQTTNIDFGASAGYEPPEAPPAIEETLSPPVPESFRSAASEATPAEADESPLDQLFEVSGLIALAAGMLIFAGGILLALWLRLVRA